MPKIMDQSSKTRGSIGSVILDFLEVQVDVPAPGGPRGQALLPSGLDPAAPPTTCGGRLRSEPWPG